MKLTVLCGLTMLTAVLGCRVHTNTTVLDPGLRPARTCPDAVRLFTTPSKVSSPYREVAILHSHGGTDVSNEEDMMESMRNEAAKVGANGVILEHIDEPSPLIEVIGQVAKTTPVRKGKAMAIYIPSDSTAGAIICANRKPSKWARLPGV